MGGPQQNSMPHGLYPGITHFSDAIDALPREFRRHNSLLNEVDGKAWALEEQLPKLLGQASDIITNDVFEKPSPAQKTVTYSFYSLFWCRFKCCILIYRL